MTRTRWILPAITFGALSGLAAACALPYIMAINPLGTAQALPPFPILLLATFLQNTILASVVAYFGLRAGQTLGIGSALFDATVRSSGNRLTYSLAVTVGLLAGLLVWALDAVFVPYMPSLPLMNDVSFTVRAAAILYGGVAEEVLLRLGCLSMVAWVLVRMRLAPSVALTSAIIIAAVLFGIGHLPAMAAIVPLSSIVVFRTLLLNALPGLAFGVLYRRYGIEHAIVAHTCADIVLLLIILSIKIS
ncbi:MAG: type II CAAX prenyl endopeptidase Rce1 family protein [Roseiflexaceae bacterium]